MRIVSLLAVAGLALSAVAGDASSPPKLAVAARWQTGETITRTFSSIEKVKEFERGTLRNGTDWEYVLRCDEADDDQRFVRGRVHVRKWAYVSGGDGAQPDHTAEGLVADVGPQGWTRVSGPDKYTSTASGWLDREFSAGLSRLSANFYFLPESETPSGSPNVAVKVVGTTKTPDGVRVTFTIDDVDPDIDTKRLYSDKYVRNSKLRLSGVPEAWHRTAEVHAEEFSWYRYTTTETASDLKSKAGGTIPKDPKKPK